MARIEINVPDQFAFSTRIDVLIQHINAGRHLANEHLIALLNEARVRYIDSLPKEHSATSPRTFINADLAVIYKAEARHRDTLNIEVAAQDFSRYGCDFVYRVTRVQDQQLIAIAKTAMLNVDHSSGRLTAVSDNFPQLFDPQ